MERIVLLFGFLLVLNWSLQAQTAQYSEHKHLGKAINSAYDEQVPILSRDGSTLYFTRANDPQNIGGKKDKGDIWYSVKTDTGTWAPAKNLGAPFNTQGNNAILGFSPDGNTMYLRNIYMKEGKPRQQGLSFSTRTNKGWSFPEKLDVKYFRNKSEDQSICLSADGNIMILSLQSFVTYGAEDLYVSFREGPVSWSEPRNLGPIINSEFQEVTPFISSDNTLLVFASNGHGGFGSKDIFVSRRLDDTWKNWSPPRNLGQGVNTEGMETSLYLPYGEEYGLLISTKNSEGYGDINRIDAIPIDSLEELNQAPVVEEKPPVIVVNVDSASEAKIRITGKVFNTKNNEPVQALITYEKIPELFKVNVTGSDNATGSYDISLDSNLEYLVKVSAKGFMTTEERLIISSVNSATLSVDYGVTPLEVGTTIALKNVFFERG